MSLNVGQSVTQRGPARNESVVHVVGGLAVLVDPPMGLEGLAAVHCWAAVSWQPGWCRGTRGTWR